MKLRRSEPSHIINTSDLERAQALGGLNSQSHAKRKEQGFWEKGYEK